MGGRGSASAISGTPVAKGGGEDILQCVQEK
jgi:hypothetical protein